MMFWKRWFARSKTRDLQGLRAELTHKNTIIDDYYQSSLLSQKKVRDLQRQVQDLDRQVNDLMSTSNARLGKLLKIDEIINPRIVPENTEQTAVIDTAKYGGEG